MSFTILDASGNHNIAPIAYGKINTAISAGLTDNFNCTWVSQGAGTAIIAITKTPTNNIYIPLGTLGVANFGYVNATQSGNQITFGLNGNPSGGTINFVVFGN